jgi:hypothetical protein
MRRAAAWKSDNTDVPTPPFKRPRTLQMRISRSGKVSAAAVPAAANSHMELAMKTLSQRRNGSKKVTGRHRNPPQPQLERESVSMLVHRNLANEIEHWAKVIRLVLPPEYRLATETLQSLFLPCFANQGVLRYRHGPDGVARFSLKSSYSRTPDLCAFICLAVAGFIEGERSGLSFEDSLERALNPRAFPKPPILSGAAWCKMTALRAGLHAEYPELLDMRFDALAWIFMPRLLSEGAVLRDGVLDFPPDEPNPVLPDPMSRGR